MPRCVGASALPGQPPGPRRQPTQLERRTNVPQEEQVGPGVVIAQVARSPRRYRQLDGRRRRRSRRRDEQGGEMVGEARRRRRGHDRVPKLNVLPAGAATVPPLAGSPSRGKGPCSRRIGRRSLNGWYSPIQSGRRKGPAVTAASSSPPRCPRPAGSVRLTNSVGVGADFGNCPERSRRSMLATERSGKRLIGRGARA